MSTARTADSPTPLPLVQLSSIGYQPGSFVGCATLRLVLRPPLVRVIHVSGTPGSGKTTLGKDISNVNPEDICVFDTDDLDNHNWVEIEKIKRASVGPTPELDAAFARTWSVAMHDGLQDVANQASMAKCKVLVLTGVLTHWGLGGPGGDTNVITLADDRHITRLYIDVAIDVVLQRYYWRFASVDTTNPFWERLAQGKAYIPDSKRMITLVQMNRDEHHAAGYLVVDPEDARSRILDICSLWLTTSRMRRTG